MRPRLFFVVVTALAVTGCAGPDFPDPEEFALPSPGGGGSSVKPLPFRSVPAATHRWRTDGLACPTVTADAARAVGVAGPGRLTESTDLSAAGNTITCLWAPAGRAESVTLSLDTSTSQAAADIAWQTRSALLREAVPGVGEQAFTGVLGNEIQVLVRSGNATLNVTVVAKPDDPEGLSSLRAAAPAIAGAMLGSLIPA